MAALKHPENICIWTIPRSGSTSMLYGLKTSLEDVLPPGKRIRHLWEATGIWGMLKMADSRDLHNKIDFSVIDDSVIYTNYRKWVVGPRGVLRIEEGLGDPRLEIENRLTILAEGKWKNPVIMKNMRWSPESSDRQKLNSDFDHAILNSPKNFQHVVLWRRDIVDWLASRFMLTKMPDGAHGTLEWDGEYLGNPDKFRIRRFSRVSLRVLDEFNESLAKLPRGKSMMVETKAMNSLDKLSWPDGKELPIASGAFDHARGQVMYVDAKTGSRLKSLDIIHPDIIGMFQEINHKAQNRLDWNNLDKLHGFKVNG